MADKRHRPVHYPSLGAYFTQLRTRRSWKQSQAANIAERRGLNISYQALRGLEEGKTKHPDPEILRALASLYEISYAEVLSEVIGQQYGVTVSLGADGGLSFESRDQPRRRSVLKDTDPGGVTDVGTSASIPQLDDSAFVRRQVRHVADLLIAIADGEDVGKIGKHPRRAARTSGHHRRTRG